MPCLLEPDTAVVAVELSLPATIAGSLGLPFNTMGGATVMIGSATPGGCGATGPTGAEVCATAAPVNIARAVVAAGQNLSMSCPPATCQQAKSPTLSVDVGDTTVRQ